MTNAGKWRKTAAMRALAPLLAGAVGWAACWSVPAQAQYSAGYTFLEAVRKKEAEKVEQTLSVPGTTVINARDVSSGQTALHIVTARRDLTWMSFLLGKGANPNVRDNRGVSPLVLACNLGFTEGVELLVGNKARVDEANDAGETPLIAAVHRRDAGMMRILLKAGADPDRRDNSGRSARDYASAGGRGGALLAEIESQAKPRGERGERGSAQSYGPSFR